MVFVFVVSFWFWNIDGAVGRRVILIWNLIMYIGQAFKDIIRSKTIWSLVWCCCGCFCCHCCKNILQTKLNFAVEKSPVLVVWQHYCWMFSLLSNIILSFSVVYYINLPQSTFSIKSLTIFRWPRPSMPPVIKLESKVKPLHFNSRHWSNFSLNFHFQWIQFHIHFQCIQP